MTPFYPPHCSSPCSAERFEEWGRKAGGSDADGDELEDDGVTEVEEQAKAPVGHARLSVHPPEHTWKEGSNKQQWANVMTSDYASHFTCHAP
jgi:hypothetical protein